MKPFDVALIGGDPRTGFMAPYFIEKGYTVISYGITNQEVVKAQSIREAMEKASCIIGGIPLFKQEKLFSEYEMEDVTKDLFCQLLKADSMVFGGMLSEQFCMLCKRRGILCFDFMKEESVVIYNAIATAEGAILQALCHKDTNIQDSKTLVLGFGRCGKILAQKLKGMGAKVCVCSCDEVELAYANAYGFQIISLETLEENMHIFEYVYNTIPASVLCKKILLKMRKDVLVIDIASGKGGVDYEWAKKLEIRALHCLGLPGKYAPRISAKGLVDFVTKKPEFQKHLLKNR